MPTHYPSSFFNSQYTSGGGVLRLTSWRQSIIPQNTPAYGLNYNRQFGVSSYLIRSGGGALYSFYALNRNTSLRYLTFFDMNSIPTQGMVPLLSFSLPPGTLSSPSEVILAQISLDLMEWLLHQEYPGVYQLQKVYFYQLHHRLITPSKLIIVNHYE